MTGVEVLPRRSLMYFHDRGMQNFIKITVQVCAPLVAHVAERGGVVRNA